MSQHDECHIDIGELFIDHMNTTIVTNQNTELVVDLLVNKETLSFKVDTGAQCNVIPNHIFQQLSQAYTTF